jgi:hypothetical protein
MAIGDDFEIQVAGNIRHTSGTTTYTVLELHRWLQGLADDASASGDDNMDITKLNPSERATDKIITLLNGYNIDDVAAKKFYGGSITQDSGNVVYSGLQVLGSVNLGTTQLQIVQNGALLTNYWNTGINNSGDILLRIIIKSRTGGVDIDGKKIRVQAREYGDTYDFFNVTLDEGESVAAIATLDDIQNDTAEGTVGGYTEVTVADGYQEIDLSNGNGLRPYYAKWTYGVHTDGLKAIWERAKYLSRRGTSSTINGLNGELFLGVTHSYAYDTESGTAFVEDDVITWGTGATAGTGLLLALDDTGNKVYMQLLTGIAPTDGLTITNELTTGTHDINGTVAFRTIPKTFLGTYTGNLIGAFGVGIDSGDLTQSDSIEDLTGTTQQPPNNVNLTVNVSDESANSVEGARVRIEKTDGTLITNGTTNSSGVYTDSYLYVTNINVNVIVRLRKFLPFRATGTITLSGLTINVRFIKDSIVD